MHASSELSAFLCEFPRTLLTEFSGQDVLDRLVVRIVEMLPVSAAGVTLRAPEMDAFYVTASNKQALRLQQLQDELHEGPSRLVFASGEALSILDLGADQRMPRFGPIAVANGVHAMFSFPLCVDHAPIGALDLYAPDSTPLTARDVEVAQTLADVAAAYTINATARGDLLDAAAAAHDSHSLEQTGARALRASMRSNWRTDMALDASEARNTAILASALDAVITVDEQDRVVDFNPAAEHMFGHLAADVPGRRLSELIFPPHERDGHRRRLEGLLLHKNSPPVNARSEFTAMRADGTLFPAEVSTHVVTGPGPSFVTGFVRDLTAEKAASAERADLEAQLHQVQRLESLGRLAGGVAHDFNNLLTVIFGYASAIEQAPPNGEEIRPYARQILEAGTRAARLTHQLLIFARRQPVHYGSVDLNAGINEIRVLLEQTIGKGVHLVLDLAPGLPPIHADRGQTDQVLLNLAGNARDAMPDGGDLTISTTLTTLDENDPRVPLGLMPGDYVQLSVQDNGVGMKPSVASHAFDPFFTTHPTGQNSGLGLATVHGIVTEAGGMVTLRSDVGSGTRVIALFRVDLTTHRLPSSPPIDVRGSNGETILVVEDEAAVLDVTVNMLRREGYIVKEARNAAEAIAVFDSELIDLLLTDVVMPVTSGRELAEILQERHRGLAVLFMSGDIGGSFGTRPALHPGLALLQKPFDAATLVSTVGEALRGVVGEAVVRTLPVTRAAGERAQ